jgi:AraC-like DNA-binding protein
MPDTFPTDEVSIADVATHYGKSVRTIQRAVKVAGVRPIGRGAGARVTAADVLLIREAMRRDPTRTTSVVHQGSGHTQPATIREIAMSVRRQEK